MIVDSPDFSPTLLTQSAMSANTLTIVHNPASSRFEVSVDGHLCVAEYQLNDKVLHMTHTRVPNAVEGRGIAARLVQRALQWAAEQHYKVDPICSYVRVYMKRHPETLQLMSN